MNAEVRQQRRGDNGRYEKSAAKDRFWANVHKTEGCWVWVGYMGQYGYGRFYVNRTRVPAQRFAYELLVGPIPEGLMLDHLCRNRACVNPKHLEPVSGRDNTLRGTGLTAQNAKKAHCPAGHPYDLFNTSHDRAGSRKCKECRRRREGKRRERKRLWLTA